jgi:signal transduction histidine kinase
MADVALKSTRQFEDTGDPSVHPGTSIGRARVVMSYARADAEASQSNRAVAGMALPVALAGILLTLGLTRRTVKPLEELARGLAGVAQGNPVPDIQVKGRDEVAQLGLAFNRMHGDLRAYRDEVQRVNANLETLVQKRTQDLARANRELVAASRTKSEFLASMSHELRTPLNAILGFMSLVIEGHCANPDEEKDLLRDAQQGARHLLSIINSILDLAKIETGKMTLQLERLCVPGLLDEVRSLMRGQAELKGIDLCFEPPAANLPRVLADSGKLKQALVNLVGNAIKFTEQGRVTVRAEAGEGGGSVRFEIRDTGIGIPLDKHHLLFQKFQQIDSSSTRRHGGTGLGLTLCRALVEMMGGRIWLHSPGEGQGTTVTFTVPVGIDARMAGDPADREPAASPV